MKTEQKAKAEALELPRETPEKRDWQRDEAEASGMDEAGEQRGEADASREDEASDEKGDVE